VAFYIAIVVGALTVPTYLALVLHMNWRMAAREARAWERRTDFHAAQLQHFYSIDICEAPPEIKRFIESFRDQDRRNVARCTYNAERETALIPKRLRRYYLAHTS